MKKKSIGLNAGLNMIRTVCRIIFPLVTFPYISRVLHVDNMGIYNFCNSIISYFVLIAGLGIETYSVREGARYRNDSDKFNQFASEVFTINIASTVIAYLVLIFCINFFPKLHEYAAILTTLSISIFFTTIGCEWVFTIYEDFAYITLRSIVFQFISLVLMFVFVKSSDDLLVYATITVISSTGSNIINAFARRKYCKIRLIFNRNILKRLAPIFILFANSIATTIYTNSDLTMLGVLSGSRATGLYSVSTKIYALVKEVLAAIIIVSVPRLSSFLGENKILYFWNTANKILNSLIVIVVPAMVGIFCLSKDIILVISGKEYLDATISLQILTIALFFSIFSWFYTSCILIPYRDENKVLGATITAAIVNISLNFILIPLWQQNGAAFTTVIAELISMLICLKCGKEHFKAKVSLSDIVSVAIGCVCIMVICYISQRFISSVFIATGNACIVSILVYSGILIVTKNSSFKFLIDTLKNKA